MRSRLVPLAALACLAFVPAAARPDEGKASKKPAPAVVIRVRSLESIIADLKYLAAQVGKEEEVKQAEELLKERTTSKGLDGIDVKKPFGGYAFAGPNGTDSYGALMIPVKDEKTILDILANNNFKPEKSPDGLYTIKDDRLRGAPVFFRFANGYAYVTALNDAGVAKNKLLAPAEVLPENESALLAATIRLDQVPDSIKGLGLSQLSQRLSQAREDKLEGKTQVQKDFAEQASKETMNKVRSLVNDGHELAIRVNIDRQQQDLSVSFSLDGKPGSKLAASIAELGQRQSLFAGLMGKNSAFSFLISYTLPERIKKALGSVIDEGAKTAVERAKDDVQKALSEKLLRVLAPSLKAGEIDAAMDLRGPSAKKHYTLVGGIKLKDGEEVEKTVRELIRDLPQEVRDLVKIDADKVGNVNIHRIEFDRFMDDNARTILGNSAIFVAVRSNAVFWSGGEEGLNALKSALAAKPGLADVIRLDVSLARLAPLMAKDQPAAPKAAEDAFGKNPGQDRIRFAVSGGQSLKAEVHVKPAVLKFFALIDEAKSTSER